MTGLLETIDERLHAGAARFTVALGAEEGEALAWLYTQGCVLENDGGGDDPAGRVTLDLKMTPVERGRFQKKFPRVSLVAPTLGVDAAE